MVGGSDDGWSPFPGNSFLCSQWVRGRLTPLLSVIIHPTRLGPPGRARAWAASQHCGEPEETDRGPVRRLHKAPVWAVLMTGWRGDAAALAPALVGLAPPGTALADGEGCDLLP